MKKLAIFFTLVGCAFSAQTSRFSVAVAGPAPMELPEQTNECDREIDWCFSVYCEDRDCENIPADALALQIRICMDFRTLVVPDEFIFACRPRALWRVKENLYHLFGITVEEEPLPF